MNEGSPRTLIQILRALGTVENRLEDALEPLGLSLAKLKALAQLVEAGEPLPLGTLAERCACVRSNITQLVDRMEADKLVVRADDPRDRRSVRAELTPAGRARHAEGMRALHAVERDVLRAFQPTESEELVRLLGILAEAP
jgi:DNA-binding MarR family transcriptional regulator